MRPVTVQNDNEICTKTQRIIFVDDDEADLLILRRMLRPFEVEWDMMFVSSGQEALEAMEQTRFDVIVSDMQMPGMDGLELLQVVMRRHPDMVRIILSGVVEEETKLRAVKSANTWSWTRASATGS